MWNVKFQECMGNRIAVNLVNIIISRLEFFCFRIRMSLIVFSIFLYLFRVSYFFEKLCKKSLCFTLYIEHLYLKSEEEIISTFYLPNRQKCTSWWWLKTKGPYFYRILGAMKLLYSILDSIMQYVNKLPSKWIIK